MDKKLLVVIDMQNDFITGALGNKECQAVVPAVAAKVKSAEGNADIVYLYAINAIVKKNILKLGIYEIRENRRFEFTK